MARFERLLVMVVVVVVCVIFVSQDVEAKKNAGGKQGWKRRVHSTVKEVKDNISALWTEVKQLSQPVHVHLHGDSQMDHHPRHPHPHMDSSSSEEEDKESKSFDDEDDEKHPHPHHKHHDKDDKKEKPCCHGDKMMKKMKKAMKKMKGGHHDHHSGMEEEEEEEEECEECQHEEGQGTHVHIHVHTDGEGCGDGKESKRHRHRHQPSLPQEFRYARCEVMPNSALPSKEQQNIKGTIFFRQMPQQPLEVKAILEGFEVKHDPNVDKDHHQKHLRGLHGHEFGDLSNGCNSLGGHMNPYGVSHGGPEAEHRHLGDFGNIEVQEDGSATRSFTDPVASLFGSESMLGRSMVIHAGADDHGHGDAEASKKSGNAGGRIACCVIAACSEPAGIWSNNRSN